MPIVPATEAVAAPEVRQELGTPAILTVHAIPAAVATATDPTTTVSAPTNVPILAYDSAVGGARHAASEQVSESKAVVVDASHKAAHGLALPLTPAVASPPVHAATRTPTSASVTAPTVAVPVVVAPTVTAAPLPSAHASSSTPVAVAVALPQSAAPPALAPSLSVADVAKLLTSPNKPASARAAAHPPVRCVATVSGHRLFLLAHWTGESSVAFMFGDFVVAV